MVIEIGMLVGAVIWLTFELIGVFTDSKGPDTTSDYVQQWGRKYRWVRVLVLAFCASLGPHLIWGAPLVPFNWIMPFLT